jgi:hypothetical protein
VTPGPSGRRCSSGTWLSNHLYWVNLSRQSIERRLEPQIQPAYTSYAGHSDGELEIMTEAIHELAAAAGARPVHLFFIPVLDDLTGYLGGARYALPEQLRSRLNDVTNVDVTDLLPDFVEYAGAHHVANSSFFLPCDAHWSSLGNAVAAAAVARRLH